MIRVFSPVSRKTVRFTDARESAVALAVGNTVGDVEFDAAEQHPANVINLQWQLSQMMTTMTTTTNPTKVTATAVTATATVATAMAGGTDNNQLKSAAKTRWQWRQQFVDDDKDDNDNDDNEHNKHYKDDNEDGEQDDEDDEDDEHDNDKHDDDDHNDNNDDDNDDSSNKITCL